MGQLGDTLKGRRNTLGISLEQAEDATKIRAKLLGALEEGTYDRLPNPGYVRGYISSYARYLELDTVPLLAMYRAETGAGRFHDINLPDEAVAPREQQYAVPWKAIAAGVVALAIISLGIWMVTRLVHGPATPPPIPATATEPTSTGATGANPPTSTTSSTTDTTGASATPKPATYTPFTVKITVSSNGASWVKATVDGLSAYVGSLTGGQTKEFQVTRTAVITIGKPSEITIYRDGKKVPIPNSGSIPTITLKAIPAQ